jgi:hypothetical protein
MFLTHILFPVTLSYTTLWDSPFNDDVSLCSLISCLKSQPIPGYTQPGDSRYSM